jgi:hypothetical protein
MIEFKADCGHTIRVKDQDAGKVVRCSYCGRTATVPDEGGENDGLEFLLSEVERVSEEGAAAAGVPRRRKRRSSLFGARRAGRREFDPFGFSLKLIYFAALIIVVYVVSKKFVWPLITKETPLGTAMLQPEEPRRASEDLPRVEPSLPERPGLLALKGDGGLYVDATPRSASIYYAPMDSPYPRGRSVTDAEECSRPQQPGMQLNDVQGDYVVEVAINWNDPAFTNYPDYWQFRERIENCSEKECEEALNAYFVPDGADAVFIDRSREQIRLVRQYKNVLVRDGQWTAVRALFLPRIDKPNGRGFSIERLLPFIPPDPAYNFNKDHVRRELEYYGVPVDDQIFILDALERIGVIPYGTPHKGMRLFKIRVDSDAFVAPVINDKR